MGTAHNNSDDVLIIIITIIATSIPCQLCQAFDQGHNLQLYPTQKYLGKRAGAGGGDSNPFAKSFVLAGSPCGDYADSEQRALLCHDFLDQLVDVLIIDTYF